MKEWSYVWSKLKVVIKYGIALFVVVLPFIIESNSTDYLNIGIHPYSSEYQNI